MEAFGFTLVSEVLVGAVLVLFSYIYWKLSRGPGASLPFAAKLPPVQGGWLPWVGCALDFGKEPLWYIKKTHDKLGDTFTINVAGKWMTFVMDPGTYHHFFSSDCVDFQAAVLPICQKVAGIAPSSFACHHTTIHDSLKGRLSSTTGPLCHALSAEFNSCLSRYGNSGEVELMDFVREAMFEGVVRQLFGANNVPKEKEEMMNMLRTFVKYDADFEYGADLPELFVRDWRDCRNILLKRFKHMVDSLQKKGVESESQVVLSMLLDIVDEASAHSYALLLLWASQSNAIPALFWTLCHMLADSECYRKAQDEVNSFLTTRKGPGSEFKPVEEEDLKSMPHIKRCVLEAVRLHAPGMIVRKVVKTLTIKDYSVPAGHLLMLSPYWSHRNHTHFPQPELFNPDRWAECDLERKQFLPGFVGFGGGRYQCPGKWFALMEMHLFVVTVLMNFDLQLLDPVPSSSPLHLIGTQHPTTNCRVKYSRIQHS